MAIAAMATYPPTANHVGIRSFKNTCFLHLSSNEVAKSSEVALPSGPTGRTVRDSLFLSCLYNAIEVFPSTFRKL